MPWSAAGHRPSWRLGAGKALCLRYEAPTFYPGAQPVTGRVGAPLPAKPYASVTGRQHFTLRIGRASPMLAPFCPQSLVPPLRGANILPWSTARAPPELALHCRQSLVPPLRGANILLWSAAGHRPSWRPIAGKTLCLRYGAPTFYPEARPVTGRVGAPLPAKPYASVTRRQHFVLERSRAPPKLAPRYWQSLVPPLRGANILPWSAAGHRPSWRSITGKALCLRCEAPTFCPGALPDTGRVGAPLPAKPCASVTGRQHFTLRLGRQPAKFALGCPQSQ